ncbi:MAG: YebC/PmpR family DNA-binding transcriptional regulator [Proteobacteria bacterium]|nr:YebC/PmpR family DNA-binding transcriptional regulator [Desulfobulbaceae bacterium]MBU4153086.1 YebC/PmpR family DNA-binding transcriptional regulator [Pseudomonadota bacterium]
MSGHSKWSTIKRKKGAADAKRGKIFTKLIKEIMVAARMGGGDPAGNARLRSAVMAAKTENMPKDNIDRAIKKGTGDMDGVNYEEIVYEGYGPSGVAVLVDCMTDNRNRTVSEVRYAFSKSGGNMGESGCVSFMFDKKGVIVVEKEATSEDKLLELALEAGAEDVVDEGDVFKVLTEPNDFNAVNEALEAAGVVIASASVDMIPQNTIEITEEKVARRVLSMMEMLEDNDDVQHVYANFDIPDELMENLS